MSDLHELLDRATDRIEAPDLAGVALAGAQRRRAARRGALAAGVVAVLVAGVAVAGHVRGTSHTDAPVAPTPSPTPTTAPSPLEPEAWDPRTVGDLPLAAAGLTDPVDPPRTAPALAEQPMEAAVLAVSPTSDLRTVLLLGTDGTWRSVPRDDPAYAWTDLSADGTRVAVETSHPFGVDLWDLPTGERRHLDAPEGFVESDYLSWSWIDADTLLFVDGEGGWRVDASTGEGERVGYPDHALTWTLDADGAMVQSSQYGRPAALTDWAGGERHDLDLGQVGRFTSLAAGPDTVVGATYENGPLTVVAVDRDDLEVQGTLPIDDPNAEYGNGGLQVIGMRTDGRALLQVTSYDDGPDTRRWQLVSWDPETGELGLVAQSTSTTATVPLSLADALLG